LTEGSALQNEEWKKSFAQINDAFQNVVMMMADADGGPSTPPNAFQTGNHFDPIFKNFSFGN
jgi:hypothetical protein